MFQVYLEAKLSSCFRVKKGDRIGIYQEEVPGAVGYVFDSTYPRAQVSEVKNGVSLGIGNTREFDTLVFPYDLSVRAYVDTGKIFDILVYPISYRLRFCSGKNKHTKAMYCAIFRLFHGYR